MYGVMQLRYFNSEGFFIKRRGTKDVSIASGIGDFFYLHEITRQYLGKKSDIKSRRIRLDQISIFLQIFSNRDSHLLFLWKIATSEIKEHHNRLRK